MSEKSEASAEKDELAAIQLPEPAADAGAGGEMHDDLRKSEKDSTLEHSLFAAFNAD